MGSLTEISFEYFPLKCVRLFSLSAAGEHLAILPSRSFVFFKRRMRKILRFYLVKALFSLSPAGENFYDFGLFTVTVNYFYCIR